MSIVRVLIDMLVVDRAYIRINRGTINNDTVANNQKQYAHDMSQHEWCDGSSWTLWLNDVVCSYYYHQAYAQCLNAVDDATDRIRSRRIIRIRSGRGLNIRISISDMRGRCRRRGWRSTMNGLGICTAMMMRRRRSRIIVTIQKHNSQYRQ